MKAKIRIPTEQFAFIEMDFDGTPEEIVEEHNNLLRLVVSKEGIPTKEFNNALDTYLNTGKGLTEVYLEMSDFQKSVFQEIKKSLKRVNKE